MFPDDVLAAAAAVIETCRRKGLKVATAESCTGGLIGGCLTAIAGSSAVFERGFLTYSNAAKSEILGVPAADIRRYGAVSAEVAGAMAAGALAAAPVDLAVAVTGVAGPGGGTPEKPVGTVQIAAARAGGAEINAVFHFAGDRAEVRLATVKQALEMMARLAD